MQLKFYGGAQEVGRSAIYLQDERCFMFDYGIKIDHKIDYPVATPKVDALILSHAHLDHSGFTPGLFGRDPIPAFGTQPTLKLSNLLLQDSLSIAKKEKTQPKFHKRQIVEFVDRYQVTDYHHTANFGNYDITFYDAGHISGSAITLLERAKARDYRRIVYTGDLKVAPQTLHKGAEMVESDILIIESTYATKDHPDRKDTVKRFVDSVTETLDSGGTALVPVFAVGRSQEILSILYQNDLASSVYIDGMAKEATSIVLNYPKYINNADILSKAARDANWIRERRERKEALNGPSIILTTSGMLNGGPVLDYITRLGRNSKVLLTGFQQDGTNGKTLLDHGYVTLDGAKRKINHPVESYDFSAHAGMSDLHRYVRESSPQMVVCVHGDHDNAKAFAESLKLEGFDAHAPMIGDVINIPG